ncbi:nucleoside phosphorylase domain-containing protein [Trichoderma camerunense]
MTNTIVESPAYGQNYLRFENYTIGWICALPVEAECALYMLDVRHRGIFPFVHGDDNQYEAGKIAGHNVVIASLPKKSIGSVSVATLASQMRQSFRNLRYGLMVGIGAGVPGRALKPDIRLGDVIVASSSDQSIGPVGVIGYELGAETVDGFIRKGWQPETHRRLRTAIDSIERDAEIDDFYDLIQHLDSLQKRRNGHKFLYPGMDKDKLYVGDYTDDLVERLPRPSQDPVVHYGLVASGDKIIKNAALRDRLRDKYGIICFEMEAAGLMPIMPVAVIRGVSDYADSHKNDGWHYYAAATAAAYAKSLLLKIGPEQPPSINGYAGQRGSRDG